MSALLPMRVFVVDDDPDTTECMRLLMSRWGHEVHVANDGGAAIDQAPKFKPDVMLVDLGMPLIDGLTVARRVREVPELTGTSLVALTGYADPRHRQDALNAGFDEYMVKPLPLDELERLLKRVGERIAKSREMAARTKEFLAEQRERTAKAAVPATEPEGDPVLVKIEKSGISDLLYLTDRGVAAYLRRWLHEQACRVGPVFEPGPGQVAFYTYSRRQAHSLLSNHPKFRIERVDR